MDYLNVYRDIPMRETTDFCPQVLGLHEFCPKVSCSTIYTFARNNPNGKNPQISGSKTCVDSGQKGKKARVYAEFRLTHIARLLMLPHR